MPIKGFYYLKCCVVKTWKLTRILLHFHHSQKKKEEINSAIKRRKRCQFKGFYSLKCLALTYPWDFNKFPAKRFCKWTSLSRVLTSNSLSNLQGNVGSQKRHSPSGHLRLKGSSKH